MMPHNSSTALLLVTLSYSDTVNPGKLLSQLDDGVQASGGNLYKKKLPSDYD